MKFTRIVLPVLAAAFISQTASAAEETWKPIGKGLFRENFVHGFYVYDQYPEVEVELMESEQTPGRYRIMNPYANYPNYIGGPGCFEGDWYITVDASDPQHCYVETSKTGYIVGLDPSEKEDQNVMLIVSSIADDYYNNLYGDWEKADEENVCGKLVDGAITFPPMVLCSANWNPLKEWDNELLYKTTDQKGMFRLKLPGAPDLDVSGELLGLSEDRANVNFNITLGKSVEYAKVALVERDKAASAVAGIADGSIASTQVSESGVVGVPYVADGLFTLVVVPYLDGTPRTAFTRELEISFDDSEWRKIGTAHYTERFICDSKELIPYGFVYNKYDYDIEVEESVERPGYIRLVDAYGPASPLSSGYKFDDSRHWYIYIDATNPDEVFVERTEDGLGLDMLFGKMEVWSVAGRYLTDPSYYLYGLTRAEVIEKEGNVFGRFSNDKIEFPKDKLLLAYPKQNPGGWYRTNSSGEFCVEFKPGQIQGEQSGIESVAVDSANAPVEYFRIDGTPVSADRLTPGVYIVRQGKKVSKTIVH